MVRKIFAWVVEYRPLIVAWIWIGLIVPAYLWWQESVPFLVAMSLYANIEASFATAASKADARQLDAMAAELDLIKEALGIECNPK